MQYHPPEYKKLQFHCIYCGVYAAQSWHNFYCWNSLHPGYSIHAPLEACLCEHCKNWSYWYNERTIFPSVSPAPSAHADMPQACVADYDEARSIASVSPRAASALLRLALQKLTIALGEKGKNINEDIINLVNKGLPGEILQALKSCRIEGNNVSRPGEIDINDTLEVTHNLFNIINFIIEDRISKSKRIQSIFEQLPESVKKSVEKRDESEP